MSDPLSQIMALVRPRTVLTKGIAGAGRWAVRYAPFGLPSFCAVIEGSCRLSVDGQAPVVLEAGDFVLLPATPGFEMASLDPAPAVAVNPHDTIDTKEDIRHGSRDGPPDLRLLGGYFVPDSGDADLLQRILPPLVLMRAAQRQADLVQMVRHEALGDSPGRDLVLARLVEVLLVEAIRTCGDGAPHGLLRGRSGHRPARALRAIHADPARGWTVAELAGHAALSRSAFFDRFSRVMGTAPMEYLADWRIALARDLLRTGRTSIAQVAEQTGYGSPSAFSIAFARKVGLSPGRFARGAAIPA
jgi:AraC-like DNA-binding protein